MRVGRLSAKFCLNSLLPSHLRFSRALVSRSLVYPTSTSCSVIGTMPRHQPDSRSDGSHIVIRSNVVCAPVLGSSVITLPSTEVNQIRPYAGTPSWMRNSESSYLRSLVRLSTRHLPKFDTQIS